MWICLEIMLWRKFIMYCQDLSSSVHTNQQWQLDVLADIICPVQQCQDSKHETCSCSTNQQKQPGLHQIGSRQQEWLGAAGTPEVLCLPPLMKWRLAKTKRPMIQCKAICAKPPLSIHWVLFMLPANITCPHRGLVSPLESVLADITVNWPKAQVCGSCKKLPEQHQKFFGTFLSMRSWQTMTNKQW